MTELTIDPDRFAANQRARALAAAGAAATYPERVGDTWTWPACVTCGTVLRWPRADRLRCDCPGVSWRLGPDGWEHAEAAP